MQGGPRGEAPVSVWRWRGAGGQPEPEPTLGFPWERQGRAAETVRLTRPNGAGVFGAQRPSLEPGPVVTEGRGNAGST